MSHFLIIHDSLVEIAANALKDLEPKGVQKLVVSAWVEVAQKMHSPDVVAVLLPTLSGEMNGVQCCRQIKEREAFRNRSIVLSLSHSSDDPQKIQEESACDLTLRLPDDSTQLVQYLSALIAPVSSDSPKRASPRLQMSGSVAFSDSKHELQRGPIINVSETGLLFAYKNAIEPKTQMRLTIALPDKTAFQKDITVIRSTKLKDPEAEGEYGIAVHFEKKIDFLKEDATDDVLEKLQPIDEKNDDSISLESLRRFLHDKDNVLSAVLSFQISNSRLSEAVRKVGNFERRMLENDDALGLFVKETLNHQFACLAFQSFVLSQDEDWDRKELKTFADMVEELLLSVQQNEESLEEHLSEAIGTGAGENLNGLKAVGNDLHQAKSALLFALDERQLAKKLDPRTKEGQVFLALAQQVEMIRKFQRHKASEPKKTETTKEAKPAETPAKKKEPAKTKEHKEKKSEKKRSILSQKPVQISIVLAWLGTMIWMGMGYLPKKVSMEDLQFPVEIQRSNLTRDGLVLFLKREDWDGMSGKIQDKTTKDLENFLAANKLDAAWLIDLENHQILSIGSAIVDGKRQYQSRAIPRPR